MLRTGLVQQTDQIVASHDLSLFVRQTQGLSHTYLGMLVKNAFAQIFNENEDN